MIILPLNPVLNLFGSTIVAFDVVQGRDSDGIPVVATPEADRKIFGIIQPAGDKDIRMLPEGQQSDGAYILHTPAAVYAADNVQGAETNRQTFVRHSNNIWKVWRIQDWTPHQKIARYIITRYVNLNGDYS